VLLAAVAPLLLAGCAEDACPTEVAKVNSAPASCQLAPATTVTVTLPLCTRCNQTVPQCVVVPPISSGDNAFQLDTTAQACTDPSSCGFDCPTQPPEVTCVFQTPPLGASNSYDFVIVDPSGNDLLVPFTVAAGAGTSCSG
jgi:hypothetical protein